MTDWTPAVSETTMVVNTILQGAGLGFVFIPLQVIAFATWIRRYGPRARHYSACCGMSAARSAFR